MNVRCLFRLLAALVVLALSSAACEPMPSEVDGAAHDGETPDPMPEAPDEDDAWLQCEEPPVESETPLDLRVHMASIDGVVRHDGQALPEAASPHANRGLLVFYNIDSRNHRFVPIAGQGEARFALDLHAGRYAILWTPDDDTTPAVAWSHAFIVTDEFTVGASRTIDLDIDTSDWVDVDGQVTIDGAPGGLSALALELDPDVPRLFSHPRIRRAIRIESDAPHTGRFTARVPRAAYDVRFADPLVYDGHTVTMPPQAAVRWTTESTSRTLRPTIALRSLRGAVTADGMLAEFVGAPGVDVTACAKLAYGQDSCVTTHATITADGAAPYALVMLHGARTLEVSRVHPNFPEQSEQLATLNIHGRRGNVAIDLELARVDGIVAPRLAASGQARLHFSQPEAPHTTTSLPIGTDGHFSGLVPRGDVHLSLELRPHSTGIYQPDASGPYEVGRERIALGEISVGPEGLTLDLHDALEEFVRIRGELTLDGAALPTTGKSSTANRGFLMFIGQTSRGVVLVPLGSDGPIRFDLLLAPDVYAMNIEGDLPSPDAGDFPYGYATLATDLELLVDTFLDIDLPYVDVTGRITLNGQSPADSAASRGTFYIARSSSSAYAVPLTAGGDATFTARLFPGVYTMWLNGAHDAVQPAIPDGTRLLNHRALYEPGTFEIDLPVVEHVGRIQVAGLSPHTTSSTPARLVAAPALFWPSDEVTTDVVPLRRTTLPLEAVEGGFDYRAMAYPGDHFTTLAPVFEDGRPAGLGRLCLQE